MEGFIFQPGDRVTVIVNDEQRSGTYVGTATMPRLYLIRMDDGYVTMAHRMSVRRAIETDLQETA